jgi:flagella basal body P-ring formation protein FlgA
MQKIFAITIFVLCFAVSAFAQTNIRVNAETVIENEQITLGDIAEISGIEKNTNRLKSISLGYAPNIGMVREIERSRLKLMIAAAGFSSKEFSLNSPESVIIRRAGQEINQIQISESIEKTILEQFEKSEVSVRILQIDVPEQLEVPMGEVKIETKISNILNIFAPFSMPIEIRVNDSVVRRLSANVEIEAFAEVFVARKDLEKNSRLNLADVTLENRRINKPLSNYLRETEKLRGIKLTKDMMSGAVLTTDSFFADVVIKSGDLVRIVGESSKFKIVINGEARASGKIGDRIAVKNLQSEAILQAIVVDEGLVKVNF